MVRITQKYKTCKNKSSPIQTQLCIPSDFQMLVGEILFPILLLLLPRDSHNMNTGCNTEQEQH